MTISPLFDPVSFRWPNNQPTLTTEAYMAQRGMALECVREPDAFGRREAWFIDIFGRYEMHLLFTP